MHKKWIYLILFLILGFTAFYFYHRSTNAPSLSLKDLALSDLNQNSFEWNSLKGKKTLLCFGASWCVDCRRELKTLQKLKDNELKELEIVVISDEPSEKIRAYQQKYSYPFLFLQLQKPFAEYGIYSIPTNYLLNKELQVVKESIGDFAWEDVSTREHLLTLLDK